MKSLLCFLALSLSVSAGSTAALPPAGVPAPGDPRAGYEVAGYELVLQYESCTLQFYDHTGKVGERDLRPKAGDQKSGYTWFAYPPNGNWMPDHPLQSGWHRAISTGQTPYWDDRNSDHQQQDGEVSEIPYQLWFGVRTRLLLTTLSDVRQPEELPTPEGGFPLAKRYAEAQLKQYLLTPLPGLGDYAWIATTGTYSNQWTTLVVIRGPAIYEISGTPVLSLQTGPGTPFTRNIGGPRQQGDLRKLQASPGGSGYLGMNALAERVAPLLQEELTSLAREFVRNWDNYMKVKIGPGPHLKGHFLNSGDLLPSANELPGLKLKDERRDLWSSNANLVSIAAPDNENLSLSLTAWHPSQNMPWANSPEARAHTEFEQTVKGITRNPDLKLSRPVVPGIDEVLFGETAGKAPNGETTYTSSIVAFRFGNVHGQISYYCGNFWFKDHPGEHPLREQPLATLRAIAARAAKLAQTTGPDEPVLKVTATPGELWADGRATALIQLEARQANGAPVAGLPLTLTLADAQMGRIDPGQVTTNAAGHAEASYRAGPQPGTTTLIATGQQFTGSTELKLGGLETAVRTPGQQFLTDGTTPVELAARLLDPQGKPVPGALIEFTADETELPESGKMEPVARPGLEKEGWRVYAYTPPLIGPESGWLGGRANFTASARAIDPVPALTAPLAITLHSGTAFWLVVSKDGYAPGAKTSFRSARRNGTVSGTAQAQTPAGPVPLAGADVAIYTMQDGKELLIGRGKSDTAGLFAVEFMLEKMSGLTSPAQAAPAPLVPAPDTQRWLDTARRYTDRLKGKGYAGTAAEEFLRNFPADLAASSDDPRLPRCTARLVTAAQLMGETLGYLDELDDQHTQAMTWLIESLESAVDNLATVVGISDRVQSAQEGLSSYYSENPRLAPLRAQVDARWAKVKQNAVGGFLVAAYKVLGDAYAENSAIAENAGTADAELRQWIKSQADEKVFANWIFDPVGSIGEALEGKFKADLLAFLKKSYRGDYPKLMNAALAHTTGRIARGEFSWENPQNAAAVLRGTFAAHAARYTRANEAHLNRELTRLNLKLASDTVGKGAAIYFTAKEAIKGDPAEFQQKIEESMAAVDQAFAAFDTAYQVYNGRQWFTVCLSARVAIADVARDAVRPGSP